jgi:NAD(P)-dependent dehydrogenase (short-subunit alcohol dehydrogenase family)
LAVDSAANAGINAVINAVTRSLAVEWGTHGIRVNAVAPGASSRCATARARRRPASRARGARRAARGRPRTRAVPPRASTSVTTASAASATRSTTATRAPGALSACTLARPMPDAPPVTTATCPSSRASMRSLRVGDMPVGRRRER